MSTRNFSQLFRKMLLSYGHEVRIVIDERSYTDEEIPGLLATWCSNRKIRKTERFELWSHGRKIFGFHGGPRNLWSVYSELPFVQYLEEHDMTRYYIAENKRGLIGRITARFLRS